MAVRKGYQLTEVGVIPEDWSASKLGKLGLFSKGQGIRKDSAQSGNIPCVRYGELYTHHNDIVRRFHSFISKDVSKTSKKLKNGDILFAGSGETKAEIGKCAAFVDDIEAFAGGDIVILSPTKADSVFLGYCLNTPIVSKQKASKGQGDAIVHISASNLKSILIPLPPTKAEQTAVAQALSETDNLITALEKLIAKKSALKKGTMQLLLTGKKRLPNFDSKWQMKRLGEIGKIYGGLNGKGKKDFLNGKSAYISFLNVIANPIIDVDRFDYVNVGPAENQNKVLKGDLLFNGSSETPEEVGMASVLLKDIPNLYLNSFCFGFRLNKNVKADSLYLSYYLRSDEGRKLFFSSAQGATRYNLSKANFMKLRIPLPSLDEQEAIAQVLTDMNNEIAGLKEKLNKYKDVKSGMMQQLLTGKIRLV